MTRHFPIVKYVPATDIEDTFGPFEMPLENLNIDSPAARIENYYKCDPVSFRHVHTACCSIHVL